jgi:hypothetical protein
MTTLVTASRPAATRFHCFLEQLADSSEAPVRSGLVVNPSFAFQLGVTIPLSLVRRTRFRERFLADVPIAWVEDVVTSTLRPFWVRPEHIWLFRSLEAGKPAGVALSPCLERALRSAAILVANEELRAARLEGESSTDEAAAHFADHDYCTLTQLLHPQHIRALARYYDELINEGGWQVGDAQVAGRYGWYNELLARFFHHQLARYVGRVVREPVRPSYCYVSAYRASAVLDRHVDREQCEYTMSLLIDESPADGSLNWPLHFDTTEGTVSIVQEIGDAVVFRGPKLPHYRHRLPDGRASTSLLFHYVPATFRGTLY